MDSTPRKSKRNLKPRSTIALRPSFVSQHTAPAVLGFKTPRAFLEWLPSSGCSVIDRGQDRLVRLEDAERAIEASGMPSEDAQALPLAAAEIASADDVLRLLGRRAS